MTLSQVVPSIRSLDSGFSLGKGAAGSTSGRTSLPVVASTLLPWGMAKAMPGLA
jgi:hypothetical protein